MRIELRGTEHKQGQRIISPDYEWLDRALTAIIIDLEPTILQEASQFLPLIQAVSNRFSNQTLRQCLRALLLEPYRISLQDWKASLLSLGISFFWRSILQLALNGEESIAVSQSLTSYRILVTSRRWRGCFQRFIVFTTLMQSFALAS